MLKRLCAFVCVVAATACGGSNSTPTAPTPTRASITLTVSPNPATATVCPLPCGILGIPDDPYSYHFSVAGTLTIQETAGVGGNIDSVNVQPTNSFNTGYQSIRRFAANGTVQFPLWAAYGVGSPNGSQSILIAAVFTDDRGNHSSVSSQWAAK